MEPTVNPAGWLIVITLMLLGVVVMWSCNEIYKKVSGFMAARAAVRILKKADHSQILSARLRVEDARRHRTE